VRAHCDDGSVVRDDCDLEGPGGSRARVILCQTPSKELCILTEFVALRLLELLQLRFRTGEVVLDTQCGGALSEQESLFEVGRLLGGCGAEGGEYFSGPRASGFRGFIANPEQEETKTTTNILPKVPNLFQDLTRNAGLQRLPMAGGVICYGQRHLDRQI